MKLSIYVGLRSIGWLVSEEKSVVQHGIKRLNVSFDNYYEYLAGLPVSKRINRRQKRTSRRNLLRFKRRREKLINFLKKNELWSDKTFSKDGKLQLRSKAAKEPIYKELLGVVLLSIATKRGYKSMRGASMTDASEYLQTIATHEENLKNYHCVADYFLTLKSVKDVVLLRETYEKEFFQICKAQNLDESLINSLYKIIFFQRPIKQNNVSYCKYERRKVMHASNPVFQKFRCLRDANNIIIWDEEENEVEIPKEMREKWASDLYAGKNITKASVCKDLGIKKSAGHSWLSGKSLIGYELQKICTNFEIELTNDLWQDLFSATDNSKLQKLLLTKYKLRATQAEILCETEIHSYGWSDISQKACKKLTDRLVSGQKLSEAVLDVYGQVDFKEVALRNLILEQHFYSTKSLVEKLKSKYPITDFSFEIDPFLKMGNKMRKAASQERRKDFALKKKYAAELEGKTDYEFQKLKSWLELKGPKGDLPAISPFEPDVEISLEDALSDKYNFDHIVPKSKLFERSPKNLILCRKEINETKDGQTGYDFAKENGFIGAYIEIVERFPNAKKQMFETTKENIPKNAVSGRQNADYNTKCFATLFDNAVNIPNKVINHYSREVFPDGYKSSDARFAIQKAWIVANFDQKDIEALDNIQSIKHAPYYHDFEIEKPDFENVPIFIPRIKLTRKTGKKINPRARLHEETVFGKINIDGKEFYKCRKPLLSLTDKMAENIIDNPLRTFIKEEIAKYGSLDDAKEKWTEQLPIFLGKELKSISYKISSESLVPIKMKNGIFVDYVYPDARHRLEFSFEKNKMKKKQISLLQVFDEIKENKFEKRGFYLQQNSIVEIDGQKFFLLGPSGFPIFRDVYQLDAVIKRTPASDIEKLKKIEVNELGEIKKTTPLYVDSEN